MLGSAKLATSTNVGFLYAYPYLCTLALKCKNQKSGTRFQAPVENGDMLPFGLQWNVINIDYKPICNHSKKLNKKMTAIRMRSAEY